MVDAGSLGFSVIIYTTLAIIAIGTLFLRRNLHWFGKAELGGTVLPKYLSGVFLIFLWLLYVMLSVLQTEGVIKTPI